MSKEKELSFADKLKTYREKRGWTKRFICDQLNVPYMTWVQWENKSFVPAKYVQNGIFELMEKKGL